MQTLGLNNKFILFTGKRALNNRVNINYCHDFKNIGDNISPVIVNYAAKANGIDIETPVNGIKHLYAVGSIITTGSQDCTVWGSGLLNTHILNRLKNREIDFRAVRGPLTRIILQDQGFTVPKVYGDPAILMPLIYNPTVSTKYKISVITHMNEDADANKEYHHINIVSDDYQTFIEEIKASELIVSSSLHGIIFAEAFGVKAVLLQPKTDLFKYYDYYYSTGRYDFPVAQNVSEAINTIAPSIPDFTEMRTNLLKAFPVDLWEQKAN